MAPDFSVFFFLLTRFAAGAAVLSFFLTIFFLADFFCIAFFFVALYAMLNSFQFTLYLKLPRSSGQRCRPEPARAYVERRGLLLPFLVPIFHLLAHQPWSALS